MGNVPVLLWSRWGGILLVMVPYSWAWFGHITECSLSLKYITWLIRTRMVQNIFGLPYAYMVLKIGKSLSFTMVSSNGTASNIIPSTTDSINVYLLTHLVSVWEFILRQVRKCISYGLRIGLIMISCLSIFTPHTYLTVFIIIWMQCRFFINCHHAE